MRTPWSQPTVSSTSCGATRPTATGTVQSLVYRLRRLLTPAPRANRRGHSRDPCARLPAPGGARTVRRHPLRAARRQGDETADPRGRSPARRRAGPVGGGAAFEEVAFDDFARTEATRLEELPFTALEDRVEAKLRLGHHAELVAELEQAVAVNPVRERAHAQLMLAFYRSGREVEALNTYQHYRLYLAEELGLEPSAGLHRLEEQILQHDPVLDWAPPGFEPAARPVELASSLPTGTVTFLFTDLEESTRLWQEHPQAMAPALARHDAILREVIESHAGRIVKTTGDGAHAAFATPSDALEAAVAAQLAISAEASSLPEPLRVRIGIHSGPAELRDGDYYGTAVNLAARLMSAGHGQQILVSHATERLVRDGLPPEDRELVDLGVHRLRDVSSAERIFQVLDPELPEQFPPLRTLDGGASLSCPRRASSGEPTSSRDSARSSPRPGTVTLVGVGGVGKTRLAIELAVEVGHQFRDGLAIIDLAPVSADAVPATVAAGAAGWCVEVDARFGTASRAGSPGSSSSWSSTTVSTSCPAWPPWSVTSEDQSRRDGAVHESPAARLRRRDDPPVEPLGLPSADDPACSRAPPAVRLFVDRAEAARSGSPLAPSSSTGCADLPAARRDSVGRSSWRPPGRDQ